MSIGDLSRINTNVQSMRALGQLNKTNSDLGMRQLRLATGSRLNRAEDDSAGYSIAKKLQAKTRGQAQALSNIGDAKSMLTVAEGSLSTTMDILQTMKEKAVQAGNDSLGTEERAAIQSQVDALTSEVNDILGGSTFNGKSLFSDTGTTSLTFQVGDKSSDSFGATIAQMGIETLGIGASTGGGAATPSVGTVDVTAGSNYTSYDGTAPTADASSYTGGAKTLYFKYDDNADSLLVSESDNFSDPIATIAANNGDTTFNYDSGDGNVAISIGDGLAAGDDGKGFKLDLTAYSASTGSASTTLDLTSAAGAQTALATIDAAISTVNKAAGGLGDVQNRLDFKAQNLETSKTNYEAANSRIADADFAKEQMEIVKLQILQQTGSAMFAQSNASGQSVLSFF